MTLAVISVMGPLALSVSLLSVFQDGQILLHVKSPMAPCLCLISFMTADLISMLLKKKEVYYTNQSLMIGEKIVC